MERFQESAIPSGLISTGPSSSVFPSIVSSVAARLRLEHRTTVVNIMPSQVSNLKAALKLINTAATNSDPDAEDDLQNNEQVYMLFTVVPASLTSNSVGVD